VSNYLALATLTVTIARLVGAALEQIPNPSALARVRFGAPQVDAQFVGCTIFVSRVGFVDRPRAALDVDYLFTFSGDEETLEPQRFLGSVIGALHANPVLGSDAIRQAIAANSFLAGADLDAQLVLIRLTPRNLDQPTLGLSVGYTAAAITLD
jgi:uncharacterized protein DUF4255